MGNSEVGHLTIGSGRVLFQDLMRVNESIADGSFFENPALVGAFERGENVHLLGLVSYGGVHSHMDHLKALLRFAPEKTWIHAFTDGRDVSPHSAVHDLAELPTDRIATVAGRYYAMDRDQRWDRTDKALAAIVDGEGAPGVRPRTGSATQLRRGCDGRVHRAHRAFRTGHGSAKDDSAIFFNFRPDRARQLTERLLASRFDVTTMTRYRHDFDCPVAFEEQEVHETMAEVCAEHGIRQLHVAETEKYAHVTYFFNGGREDEWQGETRILVPSPRDVPSYDHKPEMSAAQVADELDRALDRRRLRLRGRQPGQSGHGRSHGLDPRGRESRRGRRRGARPASSTPSSAQEESRSSPPTTAMRRRCSTRTGNPQTAHTSNPVPLVVTDADVSLREDGGLKDLDADRNLPAWPCKTFTDDRP